MPENTLTIVGNLTADPEIRFTQGGVSVANLTIASTPRVYNKQSQQWEDGEALFMRGTIWKDAADNVADSLYKGVRVIATGKLKQRSWEDDKGQKRTSVELEIEEIGPSLKFAQATVDRQGKASRGSYSSGDNYSGGYSGSTNDDEPPF